MPRADDAKTVNLDQGRRILKIHGRRHDRWSYAGAYLHQHLQASFLQKYIKEGIVNPDLPVVFDEPQFPEAIHEITHS
jgi:hypothetical protein